jgi:hypothetical protein
MQSGIWETVADTLFWMQLVWIFSGFAFMAYLAFRVFPHQRDDPPPSFLNTVRQNRRERMIAGSYRFEDFPAFSNANSDLRKRRT